MPGAYLPSVVDAAPDSLGIMIDPRILRDDPDRVRAAVGQGLREAAEETGVPIRIETIEYIPNDSPYYECYYWHARKLGHWIATGHEPGKPPPAGA